LNLASALIYRVLELEDFDTWTNVRKHYLPSEYHSVYDAVEKHTETFHKLPTVEDLKLGVRDSQTLDKVYALETIETEVEPDVLLQYVKNEYAQKEALFQLDKWVDSTIAFETAEEVVRHIQQIGVELESKIELTPPEENMQKISLFDSEEEMDARIVLGFNEDFDRRFTFRPTDYIMIGGKRGSGKSLTCSNIARTIVDRGEKALYFSIEMQPREILQRDASIATGIAHWKIRDQKMDVKEWQRVAKWWSTRYQDGEGAYEAYLKHNEFAKFHAAISRHPLVEAYVDVVYDSALTLGRINAEVDKRLALGEKIGIIIVDYINKVKRISGGSYGINHFDWQEQMAVSHGFKTIAQDRGIPLFSPYQTDANGEARLAKGILDSCDAAMVLEAHDDCMTFKTTKMRSANDDEEFTTEFSRNSLKIGPRSVQKPEAEEKKSKGGFGVTSKNLGDATANVYDA
jgi:hypothetical protein